ncbi:MAG: DNA-3-methyladenine glycosylase I [Erysipelotrichales bacterium]|nr:DNA-3-methyladenine glycosylase I [Erysipelotrichales bacterium]
MEKQRCAWTGNIEIMNDYHDKEWGRPLYDDFKLFEFMILESMQAGLSWLTILRKREGYREAFDNFDPNKIATYDERKIEELMLNDKIIRNRLKILAVIHNAKTYLEFTKKESFSKFLWSYVDNKPVIGYRQGVEDIPATTAISDKLSKDLKKIGFKFVGSTTIYAFMQATGMVNDHVKGCYLYPE